MSLLTNIIRRSANKNLFINLKQVRHSHGPFVYRTLSEPPKWAKSSSIVVACLCYWWLYWNMYHDFDACIAYYGGKPLPNPKDWTDEELGIPPRES